MARPPKSVLKKLIVLSALALMATAASGPLPEEERDAPLPHKPLDWAHHVGTAGKGKGFKEMYRLTITSFYELLNGDGKGWGGLRRAIHEKAYGKKHNWRVYKGQTVPARQQSTRERFCWQPFAAIRRVPPSGPPASNFENDFENEAQQDPLENEGVLTFIPLDRVR